MSGNYNGLKQELAVQVAAFIEANIKMIFTALLISTAVLFVLAVINIVANWRMFEKAGEHGWCCLIPFVSGHVFYKIAWHPFFYWLNTACLFGVEIFSSMQLEGGVNMPYIALASLVLSIASIALSIVHNVKLSRCFGHGVGFAIGLTFLPLIFMPILGLGNSIYEGKIR